MGQSHRTYEILYGKCREISLILIDLFENQSYEAKIVDFRAPYRSVHRVHEERSA